MAFASKHYGNNYVAVYKEHGPTEETHKIVKPPITPLTVNRDTTSGFAREILGRKTEEIEPLFLDFDKDIETRSITRDVNLHMVENRENDLFSLYYVFDYGTIHSKTIDLALDYLSYLGTSKLSPSEFSQELYKIGANFTAFTADDHLYLKLSGLHEHFPEALAMFEALLTDVRADAEALEKLKQGVLKERADDKLSKRKILFEAMYNYGRYGSSSPFTNVLSNSELEKVSPDELLAEIRRLTSFRHRVLYYGPGGSRALAARLAELPRLQTDLLSVPNADPFEELAQEENTVYVVDYDMTQAELLMLSRDSLYDPSRIPLVSLFNEYYGGGMSSVVFQELREAKALAYSVFSIYRIPKDRRHHHYIFSYIGTQADKLPEALSGMTALFETLPESPELFATAREGIRRKIRTERLTRTSILFTREEARKLGLDRDIRKDIYRETETLGFSDIEAFHRETFRNRNRTLLVLGRTDTFDMEILKRYGTVRKLTLEEIFGY